MASMTAKMSKASPHTTTENPSTTTPKKGNRFRCQKCGMELEVTKDCGCDNPAMVHLYCCGQELQKA